MSFEYTLNSPVGVHGTFWLFSAASLLGFFFMVFCVRETCGLTDLEKKALYTPKPSKTLPMFTSKNRAEVEIK